MRAVEGCFGREERKPRRSSKKGWKTAATATARENEVDAKGASSSATGTQAELKKEEERAAAAAAGHGGWHFDESHLGGHIRWSEVSALEDDDMKKRCRQSSRKLCAKVREEWGKC